MYDLDLNSVQFCTGTNILSIWYNKGLFRMLFRIPPKEEHFRLENGNWYDARTFKPIKSAKSYQLDRIKNSMMREMK